MDTVALVYAAPARVKIVWDDPSTAALQYIGISDLQIRKMPHIHGIPQYSLPKHCRAAASIACMPPWHMYGLPHPPGSTK